MLLIDTTNNCDMDLFLASVCYASYLCKNAIVKINVNNEIAELPAILYISAHSNQFNLKIL
jgi:hypothetical protein